MWRKETFSFHCEAMLCHVKRESRGFFFCTDLELECCFFYEAPFLCVQGHSIEEEMLHCHQAIEAAVFVLYVVALVYFFYYIKLSVLLARARLACLASTWFERYAQDFFGYKLLVRLWYR